MAPLQHFAREHPWIHLTPRTTANAVGNPKYSQAIIEEEGILAALVSLGWMRDVVSTKHDVQAGSSMDQAKHHPHVGSCRRHEPGRHRDKPRRASQAQKDVGKRRRSPAFLSLRSLFSNVPRDVISSTSRKIYRLAQQLLAGNRNITRMIALANHCTTRTVQYMFGTRRIWRRARILYMI